MICTGSSKAKIKEKTRLTEEELPQKIKLSGNLSKQIRHAIGGEICCGQNPFKQSQPPPTLDQPPTV